MKLSFSSVVAALSVMLAVIGPTLARAADVTPVEDERCVAQCDDKSDKCMREAGGDERKQKVCDDDYEECLSRCK